MYIVRGYPDAYMTFYQKHSKECRDELSIDNWASKASPTLVSSIEILRDWASEASPTLGVQLRFRVIYICICICYSTGRSDIRDIFHEL